MKLIIMCPGDPNVGIMETSYEIEAPFDLSDAEKFDLDTFKDSILPIYRAFCDNPRAWACYDFELVEFDKFMSLRRDENIDH